MEHTSGARFMFGLASWALLCGCPSEDDSSDGNESAGSTAGDTSTVSGSTGAGSTTAAASSTGAGSTTAASSSTGPASTTGSSTSEGETDSPSSSSEASSDAETLAGEDTSSEEVSGLAFPGALGFGAKVTGGRGGRVLKVTNLEASGPGSLQEALNQNEPRIIVFAVSGVIEADPIEIPYGDVTIAGQSAPGAGITIRGRLYGAYSGDVGNIIIRHIRIRPVYDGSAGEQYDGVQFSLNHHFIFDHVSVSGGVDETVDLYSSHDATIQWSTIESSANEGHPEGEHNYGLINGPYGGSITVHHNLFAHHRSRAPAIANGPAEVINNLVYNVRHAFVHNNPASGPFEFMGNTFRTGNDDELFPFYFDDESYGAASSLEYFIDDNWLEGSNSPCTEGELTDPWTQCDADLGLPAAHRASARHDFTDAENSYVAIDPDSAADAAQAVLERAGAFPRDVITRRSVEETRMGTGSWGARIPPDLMEGLVPGTPPADADDDGMADAWETAHDLDPANGDDHATMLTSGYTAIETYLNELADAL